jgi:hypothetical protein
MKTPNFQQLRANRDKCRSRGVQCDRASYAQGVHPNPKFFKYYWWVFWTESPIDADELLTKKYRLSTAAAMTLIAELRANNEPYWVYNTKLPRRDPANPFDLLSPRWGEWAAPFDDDADPPSTGELEGHK